MSNKELEFFGKALVREVRDRSIDDWNLLIEKEMHGWEEVLSHIEGKTPEQAVKNVAPMLVDKVLHNLLFLIDTSSEIKLSYKCNDGKFVDLADESDGLAGELPTKDGWIKRFSHFNDDDVET